MDAPSPPHVVFVAGATGYIGTRLVPELASRGHSVRALVRKGSEQRTPPHCGVVIGDALNHASYAGAVPPADTFVHLVGVAHPSPARAREFREIDLASARESMAAAAGAGVGHFIYVSVAHPAPAMKAFVAARMEAERDLAAAGLRATIVRPWYVLGPGHRWPYALLPLYWAAALLPASRAGALRLGLVTLRQAVRTLVWAVEHPPAQRQILEVPEIRRLGR